MYCSELLILLVLFVHCAVNADEKCEKVKDLQFEYFGSKTIYENARKYLHHTDDDDLLKSFDDDSLEKEDNKLRKDSCKPLAFYFIGRHSARFPDAEEITMYNSYLYNLIDKIKTNGKCSGKLERLLNWRSKMQPGHDNLITELGAREERNIARRFKEIYPEFFDAERADVHIGVTKQLRTAQTAAQFLQEVDGLNLDGCDSISIPTNDVERQDYNLDRVLKATCYNKMIAKYERSFLEFHKMCQKITGEGKIKDPRINRVKNPQVKKRIADRVANKLGLSSETDVTPDVLDIIYSMCKYENALMNDSVWCNLFDQQDIEALEYIEDVNSYIKSAYGPQARPKQSCPLVSDLVGALHEATKMSDGDKRRSYFYFTHADPMKKLLATFGMFRDDDSVSERRISDFESELKVPKKRHWRTSIITPFSANLAFITYRCQKEGKAMKHKILATVTEQPVKLAGCGDTDCDIERFFAKYDEMLSCDMNKICALTG